MVHDEQITTHLFDVIRKVSCLGMYGTKQNKDYAKEMFSNYNTLMNLTGDLPFGVTIMENLITTNMAITGWPNNLPAYFVISESDKALLHVAYKQAIFSKMLIIGCNIDKVRFYLEENMKMSTGNKNPYPITLACPQLIYWATRHLNKCKDKNKGNNRMTTVPKTVNKMGDNLT